MRSHPSVDNITGIMPVIERVVPANSVFRGARYVRPRTGGEGIPRLADRP